MLVHPVYKDYWDIPGGYVETGETPHQACIREVKEELGIDVQLGYLLAVDWAPHPAEGDKLLFVFDGKTLTADQQAAIRLPPDELVEYAYRELADATTLLIPRLARRIAAAVQAHTTGRTRYLEHGQS